MSTYSLPLDTGYSSSGIVCLMCTIITCKEQILSFKTRYHHLYRLLFKDTKCKKEKKVVTNWDGEKNHKALVLSLAYDICHEVSPFSSSKWHLCFCSIILELCVKIQ